MPRIKYPTVEEIIATNKKVLEIHRAKKADKHELLGTKHQIQEIIDKSKRKKGDIYIKSAVLLKELTISHLFASGNRRTAYLVTNDFVYKNQKKDIEKTEKEVEIFKKIRYRDISDEELAKWIKNEKKKK
ncbi:type II toxin-antitoxin system death-on-curing family toxin [Candidatus Woesearchaeota archaeon]|nr:type II toxin-antitoxin system death-on-curing family toxin [Candidatus Woesearchaeota archaeon]